MRLTYEYYQKDRCAFCAAVVSVGALGALVSPSGEAVMWTSSKTSVATVSSSGKVTAKAKGSATITAKCGTSTQKIKIIVK